MGDKGSGLRRLGCAAVAGAAAALPIGILLGSYWRGSSDEPAVGSGAPAGFPNLYSPEVLNDPHVKDQHRRIVEVLERSCREQRLHCDTAEAARKSLQREHP